MIISKTLPPSLVVADLGDGFGVGAETVPDFLVRDLYGPQLEHAAVNGLLTGVHLRQHMLEVISAAYANLIGPSGGGQLFFNRLNNDLKWDSRAHRAGLFGPVYPSTGWLSEGMAQAYPHATNRFFVDYWLAVERLLNRVIEHRLYNLVWGEHIRKGHIVGVLEDDVWGFCCWYADVANRDTAYTV